MDRQLPDFAAFDVPTAADWLGVSTDHIYDLIGREALHSVKLAGARRIPRSELERVSGLLEERDAAAYLCLSRDQFRKIVDERDVPYMTLRRQRVFARKDLEALLR